MIYTTSLQAMVDEVISSWSLIALIYWFVPQIRKVRPITFFNSGMLLVLPLLGGYSFVVYATFIFLLAILLKKYLADYKQAIIGLTFAWMLVPAAELTSDWITTNVLFRHDSQDGIISWATFLMDEGFAILLLLGTALFVKKQLNEAAQNFNYYDNDVKELMYHSAMIFATFATMLIIVVQNTKHTGYNSGVVTVSLFFAILVGVWGYRAFYNMYQKSIREKLDRANYDFLQQYNELLIDSDKQARAYRHDIANLLLGIQGYADEGDMLGLKNYTNELMDLTNQQLKKDPISRSFNTVKNLAIKHIFISKLRQAEKLGIHTSIAIDEDISLPISDLDAVRIIGILMDNAIEATTGNAGANIIVAIVRVEAETRLIIKNTIFATVDIENIYEFGQSTKAGHSGIGLNTIREMVKQNDNLLVSVQVTNSYFQVTLTNQGG